MRKCCYICEYFLGRRGYAMGTCDNLTDSINYKINIPKEGNFFTTKTWPIVHAKGVCKHFKEIIIE